MSNSEASRLRLMPSSKQGQLERALGNLMGVESKPVRGVEKTTDLSPLKTSSTVAVDSVDVSSYQTRETFDPAELENLARSIEQKGVIQPILVRKSSSGERYELVAGERRLRAARQAGLEEIPAVVGEFSDQEVLELAIIENAQREDLNPIEEAQALKRLADEFKLTQNEIARVVAKNRATVSNAIRLLQLEPEIVELLKSGDLSAGHGRALLMVEESDMRLSLAHRTIRDNLSVRALEHLVARLEAAADNDADAEDTDERKAIERLRGKVSNMLGLDVNLSLDTQGRKRLQITFPSEAAWKRFVSRIRD